MQTTNGPTYFAESGGFRIAKGDRLSHWAGLPPSLRP